MSSGWGTANARRSGGAREALRTLWLLGIGLLLASLAPAALALDTDATVYRFTSVSLKPDVRIDARDAGAEPRPGGGMPGSFAIKLADIAVIGGADAELLGGVAIEPQPGRTNEANALSVTVDDVRAAIEHAGFNAGRVSISGSVCVVRLHNQPPPKAPENRQQRAKPRQAEAETAEQIGARAGSTLRGIIARRLVELFGVEAARIRLNFDHRDQSLLDEPAGDRRIDVQPGALGGSGRVPVQLFGYAGDTLVLSKRLNVNVALLRTSATAVGAIERGEIIRADQLSVAEHWQAAGVKAPAEPERLIGTVAGVRISAGKVIGADDAAPAIAAKRGEIIEVHALSGGVTVKARARVLAHARDGESVQMRLEGSEHTFTARMSGKGRAVLIVEQPQP